MSYFLPSSLQKRILRYALSRLELLETQDYDLDNLDIAWGKKSSIELRDIGVSSQKLSALLRLPPALTISKAKILILRVTIPADLNNSGIVVEIKGVNINLTTCGREKKPASVPIRRTASKKEEPSVGLSNRVYHNPEFATNVLDQEIGADDRDDALPTTFDLAQSFLQAEPPEERAEIKAAVAYSQNVDQSQVLDESIGDATPLGMGGGISLPSFFANFLKGIQDRLELSIKDVDLSLETQVELPTESSTTQGSSAKWENLRIQISAEKVDVDGVTTESFTHDTTKRRISVQNIQCMLISDSSLFTNLTRFPIPPSPVVNQDSSYKTSASSGHTSASRYSSPMISPGSRTLASGDIARITSGKHGISDSQTSVYASDGAGSIDESAATQSYFEPEGLQASGLEDSQYQDSVLTGSFFSQPEDSFLDAETHSNVALEHGHNHRRQLEDFEAGSANLNVHKETGHANLDNERDLKNPSSRVVAAAVAAEKHSIENLAESKIFSHEEAQSMYMSAMSHGSRRNEHSHPHIPGNWESSSSEEEASATGKSLSQQPSMEQEDEGSQNYLSAKIPSSTRKEVKPLLELPPKDATSKQSLHKFPMNESQGPVGDQSFSTRQTSSSDSEGSSAKSDEGLFMVKKIITIDFVAIDIPLDGANPGNDATSAAYRSQTFSHARQSSSYKDLPNPRVRVTGHRTHAEGDREPSGSSFTATNESSHSSSSIQIGDVTILGDIGLTKLAILVVQRFLDITKQGFQDEKLAEKSSSDQYGMDIAIAKISWKFLDNVRGFSTYESQSISAETRAAPMSGNSDILLKALVRDLKLSVKRYGDSSTWTTTLGKLVFGYETDTVLAFDSGLKLRESNRDILAPVDNDVVLKMSATPERTHLELTTLPLHVNLDLRRLDETFSWVGGFSSILGLGSSMISTVTVTEVKSESPAGKRARGVRFENTALPQHDVASSPQPKITARLGSIVFDLEGNSSAFRLETSAVKVVSRAEGVGLSVDRLHIAGPYTKSRTEKPSINVKLAGLRAEYLSNPKEVDLSRLLALLCPSKDNFEEDDDILVDTLLRQRRQGAVVRITTERLESNILDINDLKQLPAIVEDLKKLSTVAKYLPEDDRPGIMALFLIRDAQIEVYSGSDFGIIKACARFTEAAHISLPSLTALSVGQLEARRNDVEELLGVAVQGPKISESPIPMIMARFIGNELEPTVKLKLQGLRAEYHVTTIMAALKLSDDTNTEPLVSDLMASIATVTARPKTKQSTPSLSAATSLGAEDPKLKPPSLGFDLVLRDVVLGLNPRHSVARGLMVLSHARVTCTLPKNDEIHGLLEVKKASFLAINDSGTINNDEAPNHQAKESLLQRLSSLGYVPLAEVSAAKGTLQILEHTSDTGQTVDIELRDTLLVIETCADSTQTLQAILNGLQPPVPPSKDLKYRTEIMPVEDMLASFSGDAVATHQHGSARIHDSDMEADDMNESTQDLEFVSSFYDTDEDVEDEDFAEEGSNNINSGTSSQATINTEEKSLPEDNLELTCAGMEASALDFHEDHFGSNSTVGGTAHRWDTKRNTYELANDAKLEASPLKLRLRGVHVIWNLFDGYDWAYTRDTIGQAVAAVEGKAMEQRSRRDKRRSLDAEEEEDSVIGDCLFNSIYIGVSGKHDPKDLSHHINRNINDLVSESESHATTITSSSPSRQGRATRVKSRKLRLTRSKSHKMTFELKGVSADVVIFPAGLGEIQSSIDVRVQDLEIFDHLPTSTWKKFATYMTDAGERESGTNMVHIEILNVRPVADLAASEIILKATVLPLRLHVDHDALDFITRFFEFKDESATPSTSKSEPPFIQRAEVKAIRVQLDFKPKHLDYSGLRSGHTTELMNIFSLSEANMVLRRVIIHGVSGFDKLGKMLNDIWTPDVKNNQLPGILAGLGPIRSLANVGGGVRDLVVVPIREYRKDGRVVRSIQKGALAFAKTTTSELAKLGAKLAIGTQTVLQGAEDFLASEQQRADVSAGWEDAEIDDEEKKQISLYSDQPVGVMQGLRGGYASLERDLLMAKDAIIAIPGEVMDSSSAGGAARAVLRNAPTVILRPALGVSKAVGQTLMGATNSLDPANRRRIDDKYKRH